MNTSTCPICKQNRRHKLHTDACSQKARSLGSADSFIGAYKAKIDNKYLPEWSNRQ